MQHKIEPLDDIQFIAQLAREFPQSHENKSQKITTFSLSPKLLKTEKELKTKNHKYSFNKTRTVLDPNTDKTFTPENNQILSSTLIDNQKEKDKVVVNKNKYENSSSPTISNAGSIEGESGFSSMNSYQEIGLPLVTVHNETKNNNGFKKMAPVDTMKLWSKLEHVYYEKYSTTKSAASEEKPPTKVLWV